MHSRSSLFFELQLSPLDGFGVSNLIRASKGTKILDCK